MGDETEEELGCGMEGDCESICVDGDVEEIKFEIGLLLFEFVMTPIVVDGDAVEGDELDRTEGDDDG